MSWSQGSLGFDLLLVLMWAGVLGFMHFVVTRGVDILPLGEDQRARAARLQPLFGLLVALLFCLLSAHTLFGRYEAILPVALLLVLAGFFVGSRGLIRDFFAGVAMRSEDSCRIGDHVRIGETRGRVVELGPRAIVLETPEGDVARVPYCQASLVPVVQTRTVDRGASRTFTLPAPASMPFSQLSSLIERTAFSCHFASVSRPAETVALDAQKIEVTIFALAPEYVDEVESAVRLAISGAAAS